MQGALCECDYTELLCVYVCVCVCEDLSKRECVCVCLSALNTVSLPLQCKALCECVCAFVCVFAVIRQDLVCMMFNWCVCVL